MTTPPTASPARHAEERRVPEIGSEAPDFELTDHAGRRRRLSELRGAPILLAFHPSHWDPSWAECVRIYNPMLDSLAICHDTGPIAEGYGVTGGPALSVIDAHGRVSWRHTVGDAPPSPNEVADALSASSPTAADVGSSGWSRRHFVATAVAATLAFALTRRVARAEPIPRPRPATTVGSGEAVKLRVNGRELSLDLEPRVTLLDALREYAGITGPKKGCDHGQCGACTVHVNGRRILSCLTFAVMQQGKDITTIEGLAASAGASGDALHPMQQAFIDHDGFQCGYCTSGQIMSAAAMVREPWGPADDDVREAMSGNICRCGAYPGIVAAIQAVRKGSTADQGGRR